MREEMDNTKAKNDSDPSPTSRNISCGTFVFPGAAIAVSTIGGKLSVLLHTLQQHDR